MGSPTLKNYGNELYNVAGVAQPGGSIVFDACGLVQAQMTFAIDTDAIAGAISYYSSSVGYPNAIGVDLYSYKCHITSAKGEVSMITVDYMGIIGGSQTHPIITGISSTSAQPIETHPNFTVAAGGYENGPLAGFADDATTWPVGNNPIFSSKEMTDSVTGVKTTQYSFNGFGVAKKDDAAQNNKAGIKNFLKPMQSIRGTIFFDGNSGEPGSMGQSVGCTLGSLFDTLIPNSNITGALDGTHCLLTSANVEPIGNPESPVAMKVVYDILVSGADPWDPDIYKQGN